MIYFWNLNKEIMRHTPQAPILYLVYCSYSLIIQPVRNVEKSFGWKFVILARHSNAMCKIDALVNLGSTIIFSRNFRRPNDRKSVWKIEWRYVTPLEEGWWRCCQMTFVGAKYGYIDETSLLDLELVPSRHTVSYILCSIHSNCFQIWKIYSFIDSFVYSIL